MKLTIDKLFEFVPKDVIFGFSKETEKHNLSLQNKTGKGNDFLGWMDLPSSVTGEEIKKIEEIACELRSKIEILVVVGIGGSYLGARAVIEALSHSFISLKNKGENLQVIYAGQNISEDYYHELLDLLNEKSYAVAVISKSGTTTEPAIAFRILKKHLEQKYGKKEAVQRIIAITDKQKGALRGMATKEGYRTFIIPDDVGGRYSVLTPVGLLPIAAAGFDIRRLMEGAKHSQQTTAAGIDFDKNPAALYAAARNALYQKGKNIELLVNYNPKLHFITEWWKQLYGESEGKENKGIFPAGVDFTTDLHSMGQYIQEGERHLFETVLSVTNPIHHVTVPAEQEDADQMNFLAGKRIEEVNRKAAEGTMLAHLKGGVPNIGIEIESLNEYCLGELIFFFEKACALSGYLLGVNPFDQPGVEAYKKNMFILLQKPGYENMKI